MPGMEFYNIKRDLGEKFGKMYPGLFAVAPIQKFIGSHMGMIQKFPHRDPKESRTKH
jgi:arylsulfatase